jgi:hypothetical protein
MCRPLLPDDFPAPEDRHRRGKVVYRLAEIMLPVLCATPAGSRTLWKSASGGDRSRRFGAAFCLSHRVLPRMTG